MHRKQMDQNKKRQRQLCKVQRYLDSNKIKSKQQYSQMSKQYLQNYYVDFESSPSFCTEENNENEYLNKQSLASYPSQVSLFSQQELCLNQYQEKKEINNKFYMNNYDQNLQYIPSLESYYSVENLQEFNKSSQKWQFQHTNQINEDKLSSLSSVQLIPSKQFVPDIKQLTQHIDFLQKQYPIMKKQYFKLKSFTEAVIDALKNTCFQQVGLRLQDYMIKNIINPVICSFLNHQNLPQTLNLESHLSRQFIKKSSFQSLSYSHQPQSQNLSDTIENIFTLAEQSNHFMKKNVSSSTSNQSCKSTERKNKNFKKVKNNKQNISNLNISQNSTSKKTNKSYNKIEKETKLFQKKINHKQQIKDIKINKKNCFYQNQVQISQKQNKILMNESMKYLSNDYNKNESNQKDKKLPKNCGNSFIATQILCEVCEQCFQPNEFFKHLEKCSKCTTQNSVTVQKENKIGFNYTLLMQNLFFMREQIQQQIELLKSQRKKSKIIQKNQRQKQKQKLEQELVKITRIIKAKQKEMKIYFSKSSEKGLLIYDLKKVRQK